MSDTNADTDSKADENLRVFPADTPSPVSVKSKNFFLKDWRGSLLFFTGIASILWGLFAALGSGWGLWGFRSGFTGLTYSFGMAVGVILLGIGFFAWDRFKGKKSSWLLRAVGICVALFYAGWILNIVITARSLPAIHDISTDLADPPQFQTLTLREDNLDNIPDDDDMQGLSPLQRWTRLHQEAYPNIRSVRIEMKVADVVAKAERIAKARGWDVISAIPEQGRLEATETTNMFRFKDDVVLRVRPTQNGAGSIIDMRSVSRVGQSDLGANAERVEGFLADLSGTTSG